MDYNVPETWTEAIHAMPFGVDVESFQSKINRICGLTPFGTPNVKLTWMPDAENYTKYYSEWDEAGFGTKTRLVGMYVYDENLSETIPPPRWALKQFVHPSRYLGTDDAVRWTSSGNGGQVKVRELRPPRSDKGFYARLMAIGRHNESCCREQKQQGLTCWGDYREPDESYLNLLKKAVAMRDAEESQNPNEPLSARTLQLAAIEAANDVKAQQEREEAITLNHITENLDTILAHATGDKTFLDKKKDFSFSNGLFIPKNYV